MTEKQLNNLVETLGLIDLGEAILYLDEEGYLEAALSTGPLEHDSHKSIPPVDETNERRCA